MMTNTLKQHAQNLRLSGLLSSLEVRLQEAEANRLPYAQFLELLFQDEINVRHQRMLARRHKSADFREPRSLENFDFGFNPTINRSQIYELAACQFVRQHRDVLFVGPPGVGKSHLIQAIGLEALKAGFVIIMRRYESRSTMMTSNRPVEEWGKLLSDVPAAGAILDRLLHHAEIIAINGPSYRLQPKLKQAATKTNRTTS